MQDVKIGEIIVLLLNNVSIYGFFPLKWAVIRVEAALSIAHRLQPIQSRFKLVITITINILQLLLLHLCCLTMHWLQTPIIIIFIKATLAAYVKLRPSRGYFVVVHYFHQLSHTPIKRTPKYNAWNTHTHKCKMKWIISFKIIDLCLLMEKTM